MFRIEGNIFVKKPEASSIAVAGAARDVEAFLPDLIKVFESSFCGFESVFYFIVENNSKDGTRKVLQRLQKIYKNFIPIFLEDNLNEDKPRTERIANARNAAINEIKNVIPNVDYVAVADLDEINLGLTKKSVESCWKYTGWNAMFANQPDGYYDIYALRHKIWSPRDPVKDCESLEEIFGKKIALDLSIHSKRIRISHDSPLVEVDSAFGGLGIYRAADILNETYDGFDETNNPVCEHLSVNLGIRSKGGKLFINPKLNNVRSYNLITKVKAFLYEEFFRK